MYALLALQSVVTRAPGWGALLDPIFLFFVLSLAVVIAATLYLALRRSDGAPMPDVRGE